MRRHATLPSLSHRRSPPPPQLTEFFSKAGVVNCVRLRKHMASKMFKGSAFVEFESVAVADQVGWSGLGLIITLTAIQWISSTAAISAAAAGSDSSSSSAASQYKMVANYVVACPPGSQALDREVTWKAWIHAYCQRGPMSTRMASRSATLLGDDDLTVSQAVSHSALPPPHPPGAGPVARVRGRPAAAGEEGRVPRAQARGAQEEGQEGERRGQGPGRASAPKI